MSDFKEFTGKNLDEAIEEACTHYGLERKGLELDIVSGGSTGIFGLVGKKKAVVRARPLKADNLMTGPTAPTAAVDITAGKDAPSEAPAVASDIEAPAPLKREAKPKKAKSPKPARPAPSPSPETREPARVEQPERVEPEEIPSTAPQSIPAVEPEPEPEQPLDNPELEAFLRQAVGILVAPLIGEASMEVSRAPDRILVRVEDDGSGLLIGRDGQTLNAIQYLLNRVVGRQWPDVPRVQLDTGDYRRRQDARLRETAANLASRAKASGKVQSTKPLSSYHRRVVHLTLQDDQQVTTRSKGEGALKRVLILPKRGARR